MSIDHLRKHVEYKIICKISANMGENSSFILVVNSSSLKRGAAKKNMDVGQGWQNFPLCPPSGWMDLIRIQNHLQDFSKHGGK